MRKSFPLTAALFLLVLLSSVPARSQEYVLVWSDEFNTPGLPDSSKWTYNKGRTGLYELQYYTVGRPQNARIEDTVLILELRKEPYGDAGYTSAWLMSRNIGDWRYGKIEISARVPDGKGTWPALWMMPTHSLYGQWPRSGEIDIMEYIAVEPENLYFTCHYEGAGGTGHQSSGSGPVNPVLHPYDKFIRYTLLWTPDRLEWYADGIKVYEYNKPQESDPRLWPFDKRFYLILNLAYGGWGGYNGLDDSALPQRFLIDYVRVYQLRQTETPFSLEILASKGGEVEISPWQDLYDEDCEITLTAIPDDGYTFSRWEYTGRDNPHSFTIHKNTVIHPLFLEKGEKIINGGFDSTRYYWETYIYNDTLNSLTLSTGDSMLIVEVRSSDSAREWYAGFQQTGLSLDTLDYTLRFDAWGEQPGNLFIALAKDYYDWGPYLYTYKQTDTLRRTYVIPFRMPVHDEKLRLYFGLGKINGKVYFDNISIKSQNLSRMPIRHFLPNLLTLYPNPSRGTVHVWLKGLPTHTTYRILVFNTAGRVLLEKKALSNPGQLSLSTLHPGTYLVRVILQNKTFTSLLILAPR